MATEGPFVSEIQKSESISVATFQFGRSGRNDYSNVARFFGLLRDLGLYISLLVRYKPDVVHLNSAYFRPALLRDPAYVVISRLFKTPVFIKYHGSDASLLHAQKWPWRSLGRFCVNGAAGVGVLSTEEKRNFQTAGYSSGKIWQVKNAVNCARFETAGEFQRDNSQLLLISRFIPEKGLLDSIEAMALVSKAAPNVILVCVGDGPDWERAQRRVQDLGLEGKVRFTGRITEEETTRFYLTSSMLVFPTYFDEGFPMTLFQSLAAGLPVVTTRIRAAADFLEEPANCLWVAPQSPKDLATKILFLLSRPHLMREMSANNRRLARSFVPEVVTPEYLDIYRRIRGAVQADS